VQSNKAAALMGAGIFECDVTFTKDKQLVCRHAQNDLQGTTNILLTSLREKCTKPFVPANVKEPAISASRGIHINKRANKTFRNEIIKWRRPEQEIKITHSLLLTHYIHQSRATQYLNSPLIGLFSFNNWRDKIPLVLYCSVTSTLFKG